MLSRRKALVTLSGLPLAGSAVFAQSPPPFTHTSVDGPDLWPVAPDDTLLIKERLAGFFNRSAEIAIGSPPPGANASNGYFVSGMKGDAELDILCRDFDLDSTGGKLLGSYAMTFMQGLRSGFNRENHFATGITYAPLATTAIQAALPQIFSIVADLIAIAYTDGAAAAAAQKDISAEISSIGDAVAKSGNVTSGTHANGYVSVDVHDRMSELQNKLTDRPFNMGPRARDFCSVLRALCFSFTKLDTSGHDPWLRAEWQLGFTGICRTGAKAMKGGIA